MFKKTLSIILFVIVCLSLLGWIGSRIYQDVRFGQDITGHLKRAADANTVELATQEMETSLANIEQRGLTSGYTSIIYKTPDEDIGFWYSNLSASLVELKSINPNATQLEKSNILMKLRETLLDSGEGASVTCPSGITIYPHNTAYAVWCLLSLILVFILFFWLMYEFDYFY